MDYTIQYIIHGTYNMLHTTNKNLMLIAGLISSNYLGIAHAYGISQAGCWVLILVLLIFWGLYFPFHYQRFKASGHFKRVHITAVVLAIALPTIPALGPLHGGYHILQAPFCTGLSPNIDFFVFVLPVCILSGIITTLMVLVFWSILKVYVYSLWVH